MESKFLNISNTLIKQQMKKHNENFLKAQEKHSNTQNIIRKNVFDFFFPKIPIETEFIPISPEESYSRPTEFEMTDKNATSLEKILENYEEEKKDVFYKLEFENKPKKMRKTLNSESSINFKGHNTSRSLLSTSMIKGIKQRTSNFNLIKNAINDVCLAGAPNLKARNNIFEKLDIIDKENNNFILVFNFNTGRFDIKGIYTYCLNSGKINKINGLLSLPKDLSEKNVVCFYRYDSGKKKFLEIKGNKTFSMIVDAIALKHDFFKNKT